MNEDQHAVSSDQGLMTAQMIVDDSTSAGGGGSWALYAVHASIDVDDSGVPLASARPSDRERGRASVREDCLLQWRQDCRIAR